MIRRIESEEEERESAKPMKIFGRKFTIFNFHEMKLGTSNYCGWAEQET